MKQRINIYIVLIIFIFQGCNILDSKDSDLLSVDSKIIFSIIEGFHFVDTSTVTLYLETEKIYPCCNYCIKTQHSIKNNIFYVNILGIYKPRGCCNSFDPAADYIALGKLKDGEYILNFRINRFTDQYKMNVSDSTITITGKSSYHTKPKYNFYERIY